MNLFEIFTKNFAFCSYAKRKLNKVFEEFLSGVKLEDKLETKTTIGCTENRIYVRVFF